MPIDVGKAVDSLEYGLKFEVNVRNIAGGKVRDYIPVFNSDFDGH